MAANKTMMTQAGVDDFIAAVAHPVRRADAGALDRLFSDITGWEPRMRGAAVIGYGQYHATYGSRRQGDFLATGCSPRKVALSVYIMPG